MTIRDKWSTAVAVLYKNKFGEFYNGEIRSKFIQLIYDQFR